MEHNKFSILGYSPELPLVVPSLDEPALKCLKIPTRAWATAKLLRMVYDDIHLVLTGWTLLTYWGKDPDAWARKPNGECKQQEIYGCQEVKDTVQYNFGLAIIEYAVLLMIYKCE